MKRTLGTAGAVCALAFGLSTAASAQEVKSATKFGDMSSVSQEDRKSVV